MNRKLKKQLAIIFFLVIVGGLIFTGILVKRGGQSSEQFKIGVVSWVGFGPFYIAEDQGFFKEAGVDATVLKIENDGALRSALTSGELKGIIGALDSMASGIANGLIAKVALKVDESDGSDGLLVREGVTSVKDLKGKRIAFPKGVPCHFFLLNLLKREDMTSKDIEPVYMEAGDAAVAFMAGKVDAAVTWEPWLSKADKPEYGHILISSKEAPGIIVDLFAFSPDTIKNHRKGAVAVLDAWFRALRFLREHPDKGCAIIGKNMGIPKDEVRDMLKGLRFATLEENIRYFESGAFASSFNEAVDIYKQEKLVSDGFPGEEAFDVSLLKEIKP